MIPRFDVLGVQVSAIDIPAATDEIGRWIERREPHYVCVTGVHGVMESQADAELLVIHNRSGLTTPDGMPMVWAGKWAGLPIQRVYGPDLMLALCERAVESGWTSFFYGGAEGVPERLAERLTARFPGLRVAGTYSPPLSTPKQERWMAAHVGRLNAPALLGVGAAFDIHAGTLRQAPRWMQRSGTEWVFRLGVEPRRLWRRYLTNNPRFAVRLMAHPPRAVTATRLDNDTEVAA